MGSLVRKTALILRTHPILWAPYIIAAILTSGLDWLRRLASSHILQWALTRQIESVQGGIFSPRVFERVSILTIMRLRSALLWGVHFVDICIYAIALVFTAILAGAILRGERPVFAATAPRLRGFSMRILAYSAKIWVLMLVLYLALDWPFYLPDVAQHLSHRAFSALSIGIGLLHSLCYAWVMAPLAIRLLRPANPMPLSNAERKLARSIAIFAALADELILRALDPLVSLSGIHAQAANEALYSLVVLVAALPYVFLYVAFALIADPELQSREVPDDSSLVKLLRSLMPLHFQPRSEQ